MALDVPAFDAALPRGETSRYSFFLLRRDLSIHHVNAYGRDISNKAFGREPRPGDSMLDFAAAGTVDDFRRNVERAFVGEASSVRRDLTYPSGMRVVFDVFYDPVPGASGDIELVAFAAVDVTADVLRSDAVRLLAAGLSQTTDGILVAAASDLLVVYANDASLRITGYSREELVGKNCRFLQNGDTEQDGVQEIRAALRDERACEVVLRNYRKNGEPFDNQFTLSPIRSATGEVTHYIGVQRDITMQRRMQERLMASDRMEALGRLASGVAHDINNFLFAVLANVDLIKLDASTARAHAVELDEIQSTIARAHGLTTQLLSFASTRASEPKVVDVGRHVAGTRTLLTTLLPAHIRLVLRHEETELLARVDPTHIEQLVMNLAVNARDAMPRGGTLTIAVTGDEHAPEMIPPTAVRIDVTDSGAGMAEDVIARAFEPFFSTKLGGKGTGLGLATCFGIAKQYGGAITIASKLGEGTTCSVWLPRCAPELETTGADAFPSAGRAMARDLGPQAKVLLVEDNTLARLAIARMLRTRGFDVLEADDGAMAIEMLERVSVDAVVTDIALPGASGAAVAVAARHHSPGVALIFVTGYAGHELARHGVPHDAALLEKPFSAHALADKLDELLVAAARTRT